MQHLAYHPDNAGTTTPIGHGHTIAVPKLSAHHIGFHIIESFIRAAWHDEILHARK